MRRLVIIFGLSLCGSLHAAGITGEGGAVGPNSVGTTELKDDAVTDAKIENGTFTFQLVTVSSAVVSGPSFSVGGTTFVVKGALVGLGTSDPTHPLTVLKATGPVSTNVKMFYMGQNNQDSGFTFNIDDLNTGELYLKGVTAGGENQILGFSRTTQNVLVGTGTTTTGRRFEVIGDAYIHGNISVASLTDRTPYPDTSQKAYDAVLSISSGPAGGVVHEDLNAFVKSTKLQYDPISLTSSTVVVGRNLSATVSAQNAVIKDLIKRILILEAKP